MVKWIKKGLIFKPTGHGWMTTHAAMPVADNIDGDLYRIYFSARDKLNRSQVGYIEVDIDNPREILYLTERPVLGLGDLGCFDDNGVMAEWIVDVGNGIKYMYYYGWNRGVTVPYYIWIGLAISRDGGKTFERYSKVPILDRNNVDKYQTTGPCVLIEKGIWRLWYVSSDKGWEVENGKFKPYYHIKYAESIDGINWNRKGTVCIESKYKNESAIGRPCVLKEDGYYKMWYSYRKGYYGFKIGYAESIDGIRWERKDDEVGINVSESGWDPEMIEYAFVFKHKGEKYMLYNGNAYGKDGIGLAIEKGD